MKHSYRQQSNGLYILSKQRGDFDAIAEAVLREYQSSALVRPAPLNLDTLARDNLGLTVEERDLRRDGIIGAMIFVSSAEPLRYKPSRSEDLFDTGIILLDSGLSAEDAAGRRRFTFTHEVAHWLLHRPYHAELVRKHGNAFSYAACRSSDLHSGQPQNDYEWREWQANSLAGALLMPKATFAAAIKNILGTDNPAWAYCVPGRGGNLSKTAELIAETYDVSKTAANHSVGVTFTAA